MERHRHKSRRELELCRDCGQPERGPKLDDKTMVKKSNKGCGTRETYLCSDIDVDDEGRRFSRDLSITLRSMKPDHLIRTSYNVHITIFAVLGSLCEFIQYCSMIRTPIYEDMGDPCFSKSFEKDRRCGVHR
jgi:hypothetical protein